LPAVSAALITNIPGATKSASDPVIATNPSGGVGTEWHNTTSGEVYICTDATAGANVWKNVGAGSGNVAPLNPYQGSTYGYTSNGYSDSTAVGENNIIDRFAFASTSNASDVGNLTVARWGGAGCSSQTYGYCSGGAHTAWPNYVDVNTIDKFQMVATANASDVGDLTQVREPYGGTGCSSSTYGYIHGGQHYYGSPPTNRTVHNIIDKFPFASDSNATDVGDLTEVLMACAGVTGITHGYAAGGYTGSGRVNKIHKYSFSSDANATDVGDLTVARNNCSGQASFSHGYVTGGYNGGNTNIMEKWSFASDGNATDIGDMPAISSGVQGGSGGTGISSETEGWQVSGQNSSTAQPHNEIWKFSFASDGNGTDTGAVITWSQGQGRRSLAGHQV